MDRSTNGQFVTSHDLLRVAMKFEETVFSGRSQEIFLGIKDPFLNMGDTSSPNRRQKDMRSTKGRRIGTISTRW